MELPAEWVFSDTSDYSPVTSYAHELMERGLPLNEIEMRVLHLLIVGNKCEEDS